MLFRSILYLDSTVTYREIIRRLAEMYPDLIGQVINKDLMTFLGSNTESCEDIGVLTLQNLDADSQLYQSNAKEWKRINGKDVYDKTDDLIVTPASFKIDSGKQQIVRVGFKHCAQGTAEKTYRVFLQQIPTFSSKKKKNVTIQMVFNFGIPLFLAPIQKMPQHSWSAGIVKNNLTLKLVNSGNAHLLVGRVQLVSQDGKTTYDEPSVSGRLLSGQQTSWTVKIPDREKFSKKVVLKSKIDGVEVTEYVDVK